jgi:hypothetical protein
MKLVRLITMFQKETHSTVQVGKHLSDMFPVRNGFKQDVLTPTHFNFDLGYAIRRVQANQDGLKFNGTHYVFVYAGVVHKLVEKVYTIKKHKLCWSVVRKLV